MFDEGAEPLEKPGPSDSEGFYLEALHYCTSLEHVSFMLSSTKLLRVISRVIKPSLPTIKSVDFFKASNNSDSKPTLPTIYKTLGPLFKTPLREVDFGFSKIGRAKSSAETGLPFSVSESLTISIIAKTFNDLLPFLPPPNTSPTLKEIDITLNGYESKVRPDGLPLVARRIGSSVESFCLEIVQPHPPVQLTSYGYVPALDFPHEFFDNLPLLNDLIIVKTLPSIGLLEVLLSKCPLLESIGFHKSCWISDSNYNSKTPDEVFPEGEILETLLQFKHLRSINLGILPTEDKEAHQKLREGLRARGVKVEFEVCETEEARSERKRLENSDDEW